MKVQTCVDLFTFCLVFSGVSAYTITIFVHFAERSGVVPQWNFYKYLLDHEGSVLQV